jgi:hypothetical protein
MSTQRPHELRRYPAELLFLPWSLACAGFVGAAMRRALVARVVVVVQRGIHIAGLGSGLMLLLLLLQTMVHRREVVRLGRIAGGVELVVLLLGLLGASQSVGGVVGRCGQTTMTMAVLRMESRVDGVVDGGHAFTLSRGSAVRVSARPVPVGVGF